MERIKLIITNKELDARATFWMTPQQNEEFYQLKAKGLSDLEALAESEKKYPTPEDE